MANSSTYIHRTFTAGNRKKFTHSVWFKRARLTEGYEKIMQGRQSNDNQDSSITFDPTDNIRFESWHNSAYTGGKLVTTRKFRDTSAWYHLVCVVDTANATAADRLIMYVNGIRETSFSTNTTCTQNTDWWMNDAGADNYIGCHSGAQDSGCFTGKFSHMHFCDGYAYSASDFGETDATTGIWKIKTSPSVSYGTNGFFMKFQDSSNMDLDSSGNNLSFTTTGTLTATQDNPSNNFATLLNLNEQTTDGTIANGNTTFTYNSDGTWRSNYATINASAGKYYFEMKAGNTADNFIGILESGQMLGTNDTGYNQSKAYVMKNDGNLYNNNTSKSGGVSWTTNDVIGVAFDLTNGAIWFSKNNVWTNSATISEIAAGTTTNAAYTGITGDFYGAMGIGKEGAIQYFNFGNGYFGTTAVTSAGTNASNNGTFEYDVPTGFTALCTKGINS